METNNDDTAQQHIPAADAEATIDAKYTRAALTTTTTTTTTTVNTDPDIVDEQPAMSTLNRTVTADSMLAGDGGVEGVDDGHGSGADGKQPPPNNDDGLIVVEDCSSVSDDDDDDDESSSSSSDSSSSSTSSSSTSSQRKLDDETPLHRNKRSVNNHGMSEVNEHAAVLTKNQVLIGIDDDNDDEVDAMGMAFYSAYDNVARRPNQKQQEEKRRRMHMMQMRMHTGHDRASVRGMVGQRLRGRRTTTKINGEYDDEDPYSLEGGHQLELERHRHEDGWNDYHDRETARGGGMGWSHPRKRRMCYALASIIIGLVLVVCIVFGVEKEEQYRNISTSPTGKNDNGSNSMHDSTSSTSTSTSTPHGHETLLIVLKESYSYALLGIDSSAMILDLVEKKWLNRDVNNDATREDQSPQWRAYLHLSDIIYSGGTVDSISKSLHPINDAERLLQVYALCVFYETFHWTAYKEADITDTYFECNWPGVKCSSSDDDGKYDYMRIIALNAQGNGGGGGRGGAPLLRGELPIELIFLQHLETLDISHNSIEGRGELVGSIFKKLMNLKELDLNDNRFDGNIPSELGNLFLLKKLALYHNDFQGQVPQEVCNLRIEASLHFLWADCAPTLSTNIPKVSCPIENCCTICFEGDIEDGDVPTTGGSSTPPLPANTPENVQTDKISRLKAMLSSASSDGGASLLDDTSPQFRAYTWLAEDFANGNHTEERLLQRYALGTLFFATNGMKWLNDDKWLASSDELGWYGIIPGIDANKDTILTIELSGNRLQGFIPPEIFEFLPTIQYLHLSSNELTGPIPKEIGMLQHIKVVELAYNQLTSIPTEMGQLHTIEGLLLEGNDFGGQLMPSEVCELVHSESLTMLHADCLGDNASLKCSSACCTTCF